MDVKLSSKIARLSGAALAWAALCGTVLADGASSMAFVMASDSDGEVVVASSSEPVEPSQSVIQIADDSAPTTQRRQASGAAHGELTVVANGGQSSSVAAIIADPAVIPAGSIEGVVGSQGGLGLGDVLGSGPRRPSAAAGIQSQQRGGRYSSAPTNNGDNNPRPAQKQRAAVKDASVDRAILDAPVAYDPNVPAQPASMAPSSAAAPAGPIVKSPEEHAKELLVNAYQLSLSANNEAQYSQIVQWCSTAARTPLDEDSKKFGANLAAWALNRRGQVRADEGQGDLALSDFRAAIEYQPENWKALHNKAVTLAQSGQFAEAFDDLCHVIQLKPNFAKAYSNRATLYVQAGDFEHAMADFDAAIEADPKLLAAHVGRGRACHMKGKLDEALVSLNAAGKLQPKDADIVCSRADLLADLGRYDDALTDYAQAIDLNPKFEHAYRNGAWLLATCPEESVRDADGALAGAQAALDCGYGERHAALDTMAAALANAGRFEEAVGTIQQAIEIAPQETKAAYAARQQLYETGQAFRTHPPGTEVAEAVTTTTATTDVEPPADSEQAAVYIEQ